MDLNDESNSQLITGIILILGTSLLARFAQAALPSGELFLINVENENTEGDRDNFSDNVQLFYEESA